MMMGSYSAWTWGACMMVIQTGVSLREVDDKGSQPVTLFASTRCERNQSSTMELPQGCQSWKSTMTRGAVRRHQEVINETMESSTLLRASEGPEESKVQSYMIDGNSNSVQLCFDSHCKLCSGFYVGSSCQYNQFLGIGSGNTESSWAIDLHNDVKRSDAFCEVHALDIGSTNILQLQEGFSEAERKQAWEESGLHEKASNDVSKEKIALWVLGPSASGKSTVAEQVARTLGMSGYVTIDGDIFRQKLNAYQKVVGEARRNWNCLFWHGYPLIKNTINTEKDKLLDAARQKGMQLVIPHTCLKQEECTNQMETLIRANYTNHVVAMWGDAQEIYRRGHKRSEQSGKRYKESEFKKAARAIRPMLNMCNGQYYFASTTSGNNISSMKLCPSGASEDLTWYEKQTGLLTASFIIFFVVFLIVFWRWIFFIFSFC